VSTMSTKRLCRLPFGCNGGNPRERIAACSKPAGVGSTWRASTWPHGMPNCPAMAWNCSRSAVLPMPPGPRTDSTQNGSSGARTASRKRFRSKRRPTNDAAAVLRSRSLTVPWLTPGCSIPKHTPPCNRREHEFLPDFPACIGATVGKVAIQYPSPCLRAVYRKRGPLTVGGQ
jgi:hypothetical protein